MLLSSIVNKFGYGNIIRDCNYEYMDNCVDVKEYNTLTFIEHIKYIKYLDNKNITCVICSKEIVDKIPGHIKGIIEFDKPKYLFYLVHNSIKIEEQDTSIGKNCNISKLSSISKKNVKIGNNVFIDDFVVIKQNVTIEDNCKIHAASIIGGKSFVVISDDNGNSFTAKDLGEVIIKKNCEIMSNCHIACGTLQNDTTEIGENTVLDTFIHIGHGVKIGKNCKIPSGVKIGGNTIIGNNVWIGVNATIRNRIIIEDNAKISLGSVVTKDVEQNKIVTGNFAIDHDIFIKNIKSSCNN